MTATAVLLLVAQMASTGVPPGNDTLSAANARTQGAPPATTAAARRSQATFDASRFDSLTANALRMLFEDAASLGLPVRPLINRALEGAARRSPSERILRVVREHAAALHDAKRALGDKSTEDELEAAAIALRAGLDDGALGAVRASRESGGVVVPLVVLTDLVRRGVPVAQARDAVTTLSRSPGSDDLLLGLQVTVAKNAQRGPGMALDALKRYVRSTGGSPTQATPAPSVRKPVRPPDP